jgi:hypothetical protein
MGHIVLAILLSGAAATMTDWFFGGVLFHDKYLAHPEIWRRVGDAAGESKAIGWSIVLAFLTCAAFVLTYSFFQVHGYGAAIRLAVAIWLIAPLPLLITNSLFIKMHPLTVLAHSLGWMVKLLLAGIAGAWLVS